MLATELSTPSLIRVVPPNAVTEVNGFAPSHVATAFGKASVVTSNSGAPLSALLAAATAASGHAVPFASATCEAGEKNFVATPAAVA